MPEISVIVPVYRAESFLRKCTDSILNQTFQDLELLLIDDGSPDHSGALCDQIAKEDPACGSSTRTTAGSAPPGTWA